MKTQRKTFLAGIAALALIAGTGFASAQEPAKGQGSATQGGPAQSATPPMNHTESGPAATNPQPEGKMGQKTQAQPGQTGANQRTMQQARQPNTKATEQMGRSATEQTNSKTNRHAEQINRLNKTDRGEMRQRREGTSVQSERNDTRSAAQDQRLKGLHGNASGTNLTEEQRTHIRTSVIEANGAPRVDHVDFNVAIGTVIPRSRVHIVPVPETLVEIDPMWRGFLYFVYEDDVVIVNPHTMRIVAVLPA